jgi:hypothetical protein
VEESGEHVEAASALLARTGDASMFGGVPSAAGAAARLGAVKTEHATALESHRASLADIADKARATARGVGQTDQSNAHAIAGAGD